MRSTFICLALLSGLAACGGGDTEVTARLGTPSVEGTWSLSYVQRANDCTGEGDLFPLAPGDVEIVQDAEQVTFASRGEEPRTYTVKSTLLTRQLNETVGACEATLNETWTLHSVSQSRLSASYEAKLELSGDCDFTGLRSCAVRHAVWGVRR
ncbi:MAG: hypothetical protein JRI68_25575 [Deltaproteobacteria bacterium]|nr:hypothetical protein [Deltaproteobacteria bacterium]